MGIATRNTNLNKVPLGEDAQSWVLSSDGAVRHNGEEKHKISDVPQEGDILVSHTYKSYFLEAPTPSLLYIAPKKYLINL